MSLTNIIVMVIIGFVAGLIARFIIPGPNNPSGFILTTILGIVGSVVANFLAQALGWVSSAPGLNGVTLLSGVVGAVILLLIYHLISRGTAATV